jgi:uncharacterized protein
MTPEERQLVVDLFDRLTQLEREKRDPDAERLMREGLSRAPNAIYSLVQTVLLQDEGLRSADARISELEGQLAQSQSGGQQSGGSFLGDRRSKWNTGDVLGGGAPQGGSPWDNGPRGSVPQSGGRDAPMGAPPGFGGDPRYGADPRGGGDPRYAGGPQYGDPRGAQPYGGPQGGPPPGGEPPRSGVGGFLGTAAAVAAGAIGGGLLMNGIRSAMGGHGDQKGPMAGALDQLGGGRSSGNNDLAKDAGLNDISGSRGRGFNQNQSAKKEDDEGDDDNDDDDNEDEDLDHEDMQDGYNDE